MNQDKFTRLNKQQQSSLSLLKKWLIDAGAKFDHLELVNFAQGYRGIVSAQPIEKKQRIVFIPKNRLITLELCRQDPICQELIQKNVDIISPKHTFMAIFLLQQTLKNQQSQWKHYINLLPKDHSIFPINYTNQELGQLIGSPFLLQIHEKVIDIKRDYDQICLNSQSFRKYRFKDFCWARMMIGSRIFGVFIDNKKTDILAPFADMLNHRLPKQTAWNYLQNQAGFAIESLIDLPANEQIFDSYGKKCNSRYLLNYGFVVQDNNDNQVCLKIDLQGSFQDKKLEMVKRQIFSRVIRISANPNQAIFYEALATIRFICIKEFNQLMLLQRISGIKTTNSPYTVSKTPPITMQLETQAWRFLFTRCKQALSEYKTTLEEDLKILQRKDLSYNVRNIVMLRSGEKVVLNSLMRMSFEVIEALLKGESEGFQLAMANQNKIWSRHVCRIISIMPHEKSKEMQVKLSCLKQDEIQLIGEEEQQCND